MSTLLNKFGKFYKVKKSTSVQRGRGDRALVSTCGFLETSSEKFETWSKKSYFLKFHL